MNRLFEVKVTKIKGLFEIVPYIFNDFRGQYIPVYEKVVFDSAMESHGFIPRLEFLQDGISVSQKNVLRGFHGDFKTTKLTMCLKGRAYSVIVDMRPDSETYLDYETFVLSDSERNQLLIPPGCGNSALALTDEIVYMYKQTTNYADCHQFTVRWDDPAISVYWPISNPILSERDSAVVPLIERGMDPYK